MWWPTQARSPLATQKVLLSSAPQASSGRDEAAGVVERARHEREWLVLAPFARAQGGDRALVTGVAGQVVAPEPLDRHDPPLGERRDRCRERLPARPAPVAIDEPQPRPAVGAGIGLGVEAAVGWVVVL